MAEKRPPRTLGPGHDQFWEWCGKGELRFQKCTSCGGINWPVRQTCEFCGHAEFAWEATSGRGKVVSWCSFHQDYYGGMLPMPYDCILVELDEGVLFLGNPCGFGREDIVLGMAVSVKFIDCEDSGGAYRLPVFERAGG
jgi:uncharacterized OB-fold protein